MQRAFLDEREHAEVIGIGVAPHADVVPAARLGIGHESRYGAKQCLDAG
ncbi:hypothetical protein [Nocardia sp. CA-120079]